MNTESALTIKDDSIRRQFDEKTRTWYFSIVDVIAIVTKSSDPRNYWKVLKNRLKKAYPELVTNCNQLKMRANDGKFYFTDTADADTLLEIIKLISRPDIGRFREWFEDVESSHKSAHTYIREEADTSPKEGAELMIDGYETKNEIIIRAMIGGVLMEDLSLSANYKKIYIKGKRSAPKNISDDNYLTQEIYWGEFYREVSLPAEIKIDEVEASEEHGILTIRLPKLDVGRMKIIKVKSLS